MISCQGYTGSFSFTDIEIIPKPDNKLWTSPSDLIAPCTFDTIDTLNANVLNGVFKIEEVLVTPKSNSELKKQSVTLVTHVLFDELSLLDWTLRTWIGPVSIVVLVPVTSIGDKLEEWKK